MQLFLFMKEYIHNQISLFYYYVETKYYFVTLRYSVSPLLLPLHQREDIFRMLFI